MSVNRSASLKILAGCINVQNSNFCIFIFLRMDIHILNVWNFFGFLLFLGHFFASQTPKNKRSFSNSHPLDYTHTLSALFYHHKKIQEVSRILFRVNHKMDEPVEPRNNGPAFKGKPSIKVNILSHVQATL